MQHDCKGANSCAFPAYLHEVMGIREGFFSPGMTLREYAAVAAMQGLLSNDSEIGYESCAVVAVKHADALIAKLEESNDA